MTRRLVLLVSFLCAVAIPAQTVLRTGTGATLTLDDARGRLGVLRDANGRVLVTGGTLWSVGFRDGRKTDADAFLANGGTVTLRKRKGRATFAFTSAELSLAVEIRVTDGRFGVVGEIKRAAQDITSFTVPAKLSFDPAICERLVFPQRGNTSLGMALTKQFFQKHTEGGKLIGKTVGPHAYISLFGANLNQLGDNPENVKVTVTEEGREWLGAGRSKALERETFCINRASAKGQYTVVLVDSPNGPLLCGHDLGGKGLLLRIGAKTGGARRDRESVVQRRLVMASIDALARRHPERFRDRDIVLLAPKGAPQFGAWTAASIPEWQESLANAPFVPRTGARVVVATSQAQGLAALDASRTAVVLNPFGETFPLGNTKTWREAIGKVRDYVKDGGFWWEMGGYSFYRVFESEPFRTISTTYPTAVADFLHLTTPASNLTVYGMQPLPSKPWEGRENPAMRLHPATIHAGGEEAGGYLGHGWLWLLKAGESHRYPPLYLLPGIPVKAAITRYEQELGLNRTLAEKVKSPEKLATLKNAVLLRAHARKVGEHMAMLDGIPAASLFHFTEYLTGGFDKQYPDHLPVRESYGTGEQFAELYRKGQKMGHLMMPYTNTSWWCIGPKGPTFERAGNAPLLRKLDGSLSKERYATNEGYTVCYWHPEQIAVHRRTHQEMVVQYPSDVLFQDQIGARGFRWDTSDAAPYATSAVEGLNSLAMEDAEKVPVATEDGYDRVAQFETMLCGMAWGMIPAAGRHASGHNRLKFMDGEWEFFPLLGYLAHDNCLFTAHDLGHFISNPERLAYALAFGYGMTEVSNVARLKQPEHRAWLFWLDAVQKTVCAEYGGQPLLDFTYPLADVPGANRSVMLARYQGVTVLSNTSDEPLSMSSIKAPEFAAYAKATVAGPGFLAVGPNVQAGMLHQPEGPAFAFAVRQIDGKTRGGVLAESGQLVPAGVPTDLLRKVSWQELDKEQKTSQPRAKGQLATPEAAAKKGYAMPDGLAGKAPIVWRGRSRTIVVPVLADAPDSWVDLDGAAWLKALTASPQLKQAGYEIKAVTSTKELMAMLRATAPNRPFAVVNPGGEYFHGDQPDEGETLATIKDYIRHGGIWWETGGYSFHSYAYPGAEGKWQTKGIGPRGASTFGFGCGSHDVEDPPRVLKVTDEGRVWLGAARAAELARLRSGVQRPFTGRPEALNLVLGDRDGFVAGIRLDGWGWLWRLGGFRPDPKAAQLAVVGALEHLATQPWPVPPRSKQSLFWSLK
jgi:hypothetical protein